MEPSKELQLELERQYLRTCETCSVAFMPKTTSQKYCCNGCKMKAYRIRKGGGLNGLGARQRTVTNTDLHQTLLDMHKEHSRESKHQYEMVTGHLEGLRKLNLTTIERLANVRNWQLAHFAIYGIVEVIKTEWFQKLISKKNGVEDLLQKYQGTLIGLAQNEGDLRAYIKANPKAYTDLVNTFDIQIQAARSAGDTMKVVNLSKAKETVKNIMQSMIGDNLT